MIERSKTKNSQTDRSKTGRDRAERSQVERTLAQSYLREFLPAVAGYTVCLGAIMLLADFETAGWWKYAVALLPVLPAMWGLLAVRRHVGRIDEMQQMIMLEGLAFGFGTAMIAAMTVGFLSVGGLDTNRWGPWMIYSLGMLGWIVGQAQSRRTRG